MDLIPKPGQVASAAGNVAHKVLYGGLADLRPMPRTLIDDGMLRELYHYRPSASVVDRGDPVLLVTPLAAPALCFDLRRGCSVAEHFVHGGARPTWWSTAQVSFRDRALGMEHWIDEVVPAAIRRSPHTPAAGPVHVIGWSLRRDLRPAHCRRPPGPPDRLGDRGGLARRRQAGTAGRAAAPAAQPRPRAAGSITRGYQAMGGAPSRWSGGPSSSPRSRSWSPGRWRSRPTSTTWTSSRSSRRWTASRPT